MKTLFIIFSLIFSINAISQDEDIDRLAIASVLIKDNQLSRAASVLNEILDPDDVDTPRFYALKGVLAVKQKQFDLGAKFLKMALDMELEISDVYENLARCYVETKKPKEGIELLNSKWELLKSSPTSHQLLAQGYFLRKQQEKAWSILNLAIKAFPNHLGLKKQKWFYLYENNLLQISKGLFWQLEKDHDLSALDLARFAYQYRKKNQIEMALKIGELARFKAPSNEEIIKDLARTYIKLENITAAARLFEDLARSNYEYYFEASELYRKAGHRIHADNLALMIPSRKNRLKQRLTIALDNKDYQKLTSYGHLIERSELKDNEDIQYTLAYGHFMLGEFDKVEGFLSKIQRNDLFKKALALRKTIESCQEKEGSCL